MRAVRVRIRYRARAAAARATGRERGAGCRTAHHRPEGHAERNREHPEDELIHAAGHQAASRLDGHGIDRAGEPGVAPDGKLAVRTADGVDAEAVAGRRDPRADHRSAGLDGLARLRGPALEASRRAVTGGPADRRHLDLDALVIPHPGRRDHHGPRHPPSAAMTMVERLHHSSRRRTRGIERDRRPRVHQALASRACEPHPHRRAGSDPSGTHARPGTPRAGRRPPKRRQLRPRRRTAHRGLEGHADRVRERPELERAAAGAQPAHRHDAHGIDRTRKSGVAADRRRTGRALHLEHLIPTTGCRRPWADHRRARVERLARLGGRGLGHGRARQHEGGGEQGERDGAEPDGAQSSLRGPGAE